MKIKYHTIEATIISDSKEILKINGQINQDMDSFGNPEVTVYNICGESGMKASFPTLSSMPLSEFINEFGNSHLIAYALKKGRPREYITKIKIKNKITH